jgi:hypothetical protein
MHCNQPHVVCLFKSRIGRQAKSLGSTEVARVIHVSLFAARLQFAGGASADHQDLFFAQRTVREVLNRSADAPAILSN